MLSQVAGLLSTIAAQLPEFMTTGMLAFQSMQAYFYFLLVSLFAMIGNHSRRWVRPYLVSRSRTCLDNSGEIL